MTASDVHGPDPVSSDGRRRVVIDGLWPEIDCGRHPIKRVVGDTVTVEANVFADGHDAISAVLLHKPEPAQDWCESPMHPLGNDRWRGEFRVGELGRYRYAVLAWIDHFKTWARDLGKRVEAGQDVSVDLMVGADLVEAAASRAKGPDAKKLTGHARTLRAGGDEATVLHAELIELGWTGSLRTVQHYLHRFRDPARAPRSAPPAPDKTTPRRVTSWIMTNPEHLSAGDQVRLKQVLARCPQLEATAGHVASFAAMMGQRTGKEQLPGWLDAVTAEDLPALHSLVAGLRRDLDAVTNGLSLDYSSGQVEGNVNRIKMIKRQMFGRAKFDLLRKRVLLAH